MRDTSADGKFLCSLGARIRHARKARGWSQEVLALESGLHRTYIGSTERGERNISVTNLRRIAHALGVAVAQLLPDRDGDEGATPDGT